MVKQSPVCGIGTINVNSEERLILNLKEDEILDSILYETARYRPKPLAHEQKCRDR